MATKYYTRFLLHSQLEAEADEYSGVVELRQPEAFVLESHQIEALLASSFDLESERVRLLNWAPLH